MDGELKTDKIDKKTAPKAIVSGLFLSVLFVSSFFVSEIISYKSLLLSFIYTAITAAVYMTLMISERKSVCLLKFGLSVSLSFLVIQYFWDTHYSVRALNWVFPGYGNQSAGGRFAGFVLLLYHLILFLIGCITGFIVKPKKYEHFEKAILLTGFAFTLVTVLSVLKMEQDFPSYEQIMLYSYS